MDELIKFETAKLAKEKGFNIFTENKFIVNEKTFGIKEINGVVPYIIDGCDTLYRPTQTALAKWLREVHHIELWFGYLNPPNKYHVEDIIKDGIIVSGIHIGSEKWEEAHEAGLLEALKFVGIDAKNYLL